MWLDLAALVRKSGDPPEALLKPPPCVRVCVCVYVFNLQAILRICVQTGPALQALVFRNADAYLLFEYYDLILTCLKYK